jgi:alpha-ketoglutarate-dependent taurine dioxygenase
MEAILEAQRATIKRLSPALGAEVAGLNLSRPVDSGTIGQLKAVRLSYEATLFSYQSRPAAIG